MVELLGASQVDRPLAANAESQSEKKNIPLSIGFLSIFLLRKSLVGAAFSSIPLSQLPIFFFFFKKICLGFLKKIMINQEHPRLRHTD